MQDKVGKIWFDYVEAWNGSANRYAKLFPELRFSFRDLFLTRSHTNMLLRFLSAKALQTIQDGGGGEGTGTGIQNIHDFGLEGVFLMMSWKGRWMR